MKSDQYGFIKWAEYLSRIPLQNTTSIYILTESATYAECPYFPACKEIQKHLVAFLRKNYPLAMVAIRRGNNCNNHYNNNTNWHQARFLVLNHNAILLLTLILILSPPVACHCVCDCLCLNHPTTILTWILILFLVVDVCLLLFVIVFVSGHPNDAMVMLSRAPIVICCSSTFCLYPALSRSSGVSYLQHTSLLAGGSEPVINEHVKWISTDHIAFTHPASGKDPVNSPQFIKTVLDRLAPPPSKPNDNRVSPSRKLTTSFPTESTGTMSMSLMHVYKRQISRVFLGFIFCFVLYLCYRIIFQWTWLRWFHVYALLR